VAFDLHDVVWDAGKIPQADVVIGCCANLVAVDPTDHCVRFAHPSVKTYLQKDSASFVPGYPESDKQGELQCGEFCVAYLSFSNFNLQLVKPANETAAVKVPDAKLLAGDALASRLARVFWGRGANPKSPTQLQFRQVRSATVPDRSQYRFLDYAITYWALQTKEFTSSSPVKDKFKQLSLCFNETWNFHPWVVGGRSQSSRLHGLFGWAVKEGHIPLLEMALSSRPDALKICNLPLINERLPALHVASKLGLADVVQRIESICQTDLQDEEGYTALHHAASKGHVNVVVVLLKSINIGVDVLSKTQVTPLWLAASHGHRDAVRILASRHANIEAREGSTRRTPLLQAAGNGHHAVVGDLVDRGAKLESKDAGGRTPLSWAFKNGHSDTVQLLLEKGANPDCKDAKEQLLSWAARTGHVAITVLLATNPKTNLNATDDNGLTPLLCAAYNERLVIAKILLNRGADLEARDERGRTPLMCAASNRDEGLARLLLEKGAVIEAKDKYERTAFFWAVKNSHEEMVKLLLDWSGHHAGNEKFIESILSWAARTPTDNAMSLFLRTDGDREDEALPMPTSLLWVVRKSYGALAQQFKERDTGIDREDLFKRGAIIWSTGQGQKALLELLLGKSTAHERMALLGLKDKTAETVDHSNGSLPSVAKQGHMSAVQRLLKKSTDIETKDALGYTALLWAVREGHSNITRLLVNHGANIHARTPYGETPLWWAARSGHDSLVEFLHDRGADIESRDKFGLTPLAWAVENDHSAVARLLVGWGANIMAADKAGQSPLSRAFKKKEMQNLLLGK
jgi:ankyrin repeat protein